MALLFTGASLLSADALAFIFSLFLALFSFLAWMRLEAQARKQEMLQKFLEY